MKKLDIDNRSSLNFYLENDLQEILSDNPISRFDESKKAKELAQKKTANSKINNKIDDKVHGNKAIEPRKTQDVLLSRNSTNSNSQKKDSFINPIFSTSAAVSSLAKRFNDNTNSVSNIPAFQPINDIIKQAQALAAKAQTSLDLKKAVEEFEGCNLKKMATNTVFCDGNPQSEIMILGEAPGNHEDLQGIPFCGDSGKVLDAMFQAINMKRDCDYYISNVIFWRPPGNRRPTDEELAICRPFVERHIQLINPKVIILVGATAMNAILNKSEPISKIRGQFLDFKPDFLDKTTKTFVIFHPSYLMRQPAKKKIAWQDMLSLEKFIKTKISDE